MDTTTRNYGIEAKQPKRNYKAEGDEVIKNLKSSSAYCRQFFFDTEVAGKKGKKACQIAPLRSKMIYDLSRDYGVNVKPEDFSTILYTTVWAGGTFAPLDNYHGDSSFYAWLKSVAWNAVMDRLVEEGLVDDVRSRTVGNTRLALRSQSPTKCLAIIDGLMVGSKYHRLLTAIYVDRLSEEQIMKRLHMKDAAEYNAAKKAGDDTLKDALLRSVEFAEENVIRDRRKHVVTVSMEFVDDLSDWVEGKTGVNFLSDVFGTDLTKEEIRQKTVEFLYDFSAKLWPEKIGKGDEDEETRKKNEAQEIINKRDRYIWCERFIRNVSPEDVADMVEHDYNWLNTRYSRLNNKFAKAIRKWWYSHAA